MHPLGAVYISIGRVEAWQFHPAKAAGHQIPMTGKTFWIAAQYHAAMTTKTFWMTSLCCA